MSPLKLVLSLASFLDGCVRRFQTSNWRWKTMYSSTTTQSGEPGSHIKVQIIWGWPTAWCHSLLSGYFYGLFSSTFFTSMSFLFMSVYDSPLMVRSHQKRKRGTNPYKRPGSRGFRFILLVRMKQIRRSLELKCKLSCKFCLMWNQACERFHTHNNSPK